MKHRGVVVSLGICLRLVAVVCSLAAVGSAQQAAVASTTTATSAVPKVVNYSGTLKDLNGRPLTGVTGVTFLLYKEAQGGAPLWMETQNVQPSKDGRYSATLGSTTSRGLPADVFVSGEARWLGVQIQGQDEQPRVLLVAVPYALKSGDAETLGGLPPSAFLLAAPLASAASAAAPAASSSSATAPPPAAITGSGTAGFLPDFTGAATIGNSAVFQTGASPTAKIGINTNAPLATLDIHGGAAVRGTLVLPATGTATAAAGKASQPESMAASSFNSGASTPVTETFQLKAEPVNNNTPSASASLNVLFGQGTNAPAETGLKINSNGRITFAAGQAFPGTGTVSSVGSGLGLTGGPITGSGTLAIDTSVVPRLSGGNNFSGNQSVTGNISASGSITGGSFSGVGSGLSSVNAASVDGWSASSFAFVGFNNFFTGAQTFAPTFPTPALTFWDDGVLGDLQPTLIINAVDCCNYGSRMIWAHSPSFPEWGIYYRDLDDHMIWQQNSTAPAMDLDFSGKLTLTGTLTAAAKNFKIDHPLDPTNKYLYHDAVESSEMMNIYTGNAVLDGAGQARVSLPDWFEAVNADFRYQLTAIGAAAPGLHIAREIANHEFSIAGGAPGMKVSWQVTGVRHDGYAQAHPMTVEVTKPEKERGHYLHPEAYGQPVLTQDEMFRQRQLQDKSKGQSEHPLRSMLQPAKQ
jgi:hypothetical protein